MGRIDDHAPSASWRTQHKSLWRRVPSYSRYYGVGKTADGNGNGIGCCCVVDKTGGEQ